MKTLTLISLALCACGVPDYSAFPMTRCGLHYEGIDVATVQTTEDVIVSTFQGSLDSSLHNVCAALAGWKLTVSAEPIVPGVNVIDDANPEAAVDGFTDPASMEIKVYSAHYVLPHEAAHVAQGCTEASGLHTGWNNVCSDGTVCVCTNGLDGLHQPCAPGLVQPQLIDARAQLDVLFPGDVP